jgi:tRNA-dihydrouridine synthase A
VAQSGVTSFTIHARKAWLKGLSPKENRDVPPLDYDIVRRLKAERPDLEIILNGGLGDLDHALSAGAGLDGVMLGRAAYHTPWLLAEVDRRVFGAPNPVSDPVDAVFAYRAYVERELDKSVRLHAITRHMLGLFTGTPGARKWRRILSEKANRPGAGWAVVEEALAAVAPERVPA